MRAWQWVLRYAWRPARGQGRRHQLSGALCSRPLQPVDQQDRRSAGENEDLVNVPNWLPLEFRDRRRRDGLAAQLDEGALHRPG